MAAVPTNDVEKQLAWEARQRPRAGIAATVGVVGLIGFFILQNLLGRDAPQPSGLETFGRVGKSGSVADQPSLQTPVFQYLDSHIFLIVMIGVCGFIGYLGMAWAVSFLGVATRARRPELPRWAIYLPIIGGVLMALGTLGYQIGQAALPGHYLSTSRTVADAADAGGGLLAFARIVGTLGSFALALGLFLVSLNAMRAGLLTRVFGYLGVAAAAFLVLFPFPIVQFFWLAGLGLLLLGVWPGGPPPAWAAGKAIDWPNTRPARGRGRGEPATASAEPAPSGAPSAARKRKKRR